MERKDIELVVDKLKKVAEKEIAPEDKLAILISAELIEKNICVICDDYLL